MPSVDIIADDTIEFQRRIIEKYEQEHGVRPKIYAIGHSMGGMQLLNILLRPHQDHGKEAKRKTATRYDGVCLWSPFFDFKREVKPQIKFVMPFLKCRYKCKTHAHTPKYKIDLYETPEHLVHWRIDFDNPFKKSSVPIHTLVEMRK